MTPDRPRTRVLLSAARPASSGNPYVRLLAESLRPEADVRFFDWRVALFSRYDVFHVHWPEHLTRGAGFLRTAAKSALFALLLVVIMCRKTVVVRTLHNRAPHEQGSPVEKLLHRTLDAITGSTIHLVPPSADGMVGLRDVVVPHGHYRSEYLPVEPLRRATGTLLYFGHVRPYKGVPRLCAQFRSLRREDLRLEVVGRPMNRRIADEVRAAAGDERRIRLTLAELSADDLSRALRDATLVVLPFEEFHNSGSVLLALSLNRPVLVPRSEASVLLQREVGAEWVHTFTGPLTAEVIGRTYDAVADHAEEQGFAAVRFDGRDWSEVAASHLDVYRHAARDGEGHVRSDHP
jgi:beta-1,4-mannosyltransferase